MTTEKNTPVTQPKQALTVNSLMNGEAVKKKFSELLGQKAQGFITSVLQVVASNDLLKKADPHSVYNAAAMAATLDLPINSNLGFAYIIAYNTKQSDGSYKSMAAFQMGYKGFIQLAQRSGLYENIAGTEIYEGQIVSENPLTGYVFDFTQRKSDKIVGFAAYFKLLNGFNKTLYMTIEEMEKHGAKYSKTYSKSNSLWKTDFVSMGTKTVIKLLLSKFGPLSIEMQKAIAADQAVINDDNGESMTYVDHEEIPIDKEAERVTLMLQDCKNEAEVDALMVQIPDADPDLFNQRKEELKDGKGK